MSKVTADIIVLHKEGKEPDKQSLMNCLLHIKGLDADKINIYVGPEFLNHKNLLECLHNNCYLILVKKNPEKGLDFEYTGGKINIDIYRRELKANADKTTAEILERCFNSQLFKAK